MPKSPAIIRSGITRRERTLPMREFIDIFFGVEDIKQYLLEEIKAQQKEKEDAEKTAKEKGAKEARDNFFKAKFTFAHMMFAVLTAGPICGIFGYLFLRLLFG